MTEMIGGAALSASSTALLLTFPRPRPALSTALWGGGFRRVRHALNQKLTGYWTEAADFPGGSPEAFLRLSLLEKGCPPEESCAFLTTAKIEWMRRASRRAGTLAVDVIATGGVEKTAARAGDPPLYREEDGRFYPAGTINLMVLVNASLPPYAMARALITVTEGKTAALQDLGIASVYTGRPATGTATDGVMLFCDGEGPRLTDAGTFSALGFCLADAVRDAVTGCLSDFDRPWNRFDALAAPPAVDVSHGKPRG